jgi:DNA-binding NarL/FixJ family response regulator
MRSMKVGIVAANDLVRSGVESIINSTTQPTQIVGSFQSLAECENFLTRQHQHIPILLLDDALPGTRKPMEVIARLCDHYPFMKIVILSNYLSEYYVQHLIDNGAAGFIYKNDQLVETLIPGIRTIAAGHVYLSPQASGLPYRRMNDDLLNPTDDAVLQLLATGLTVQEIAARLGVVPTTVYRIRGKLRDYLKVRTNEQIVEAAKQRGLIDHTEPEILE